MLHEGTLLVLVLDVCGRMLFVTVSDCCFSRGNSHIPVLSFLVPLSISCTFFFTSIYFLSSVMVHPSSHKTPNYISGDVFTFGQMWICLDCLLIPGICSVAMCEDSIVLPSGSLAVISFYIIKVSIVVVDCFVRCIFSPESTISRMLLLGEFYGVPIQFIKLILGLLTSILFIISPNHHSHPFLFPPSLLL